MSEVLEYLDGLDLYDAGSAYEAQLLIESALTELAVDHLDGAVAAAYDAVCDCAQAQAYGEELEPEMFEKAETALIVVCDFLRQKAQGPE